MTFTWDANKSERNLRERGFDFEFAAEIMVSPVLVKVIEGKEYGEPRFIAIGETDGIVFTVIYTRRVGEDGEVVRKIISARRASRKERSRYEKAQRQN